MANERFDARLWRDDHAGTAVAAAPHGAGASDPSLGELFRQLSSDTAELVQQEMRLAKAELRETTSRVGRDTSKIGIAAGLALAGVLALTAFLIAGLGALLGDNYWLSALIVGVVLLAIGGALLKSAISDLKHHGLAPTQTIASLRDDAGWAQRQARELGRELRP